MEDKISVIVPAYNIENYLGRCLDGLLKQKHHNLEIIIVNDGSVDRTGSIMDEYAARDSRIRVFHKKNGGVTSARLYGLAQATGDWIGFVDGDDYVESDMYARLLKNAQEHHAEISHCGYQMVYPSGKIDYYYNTEKFLIQEGSQGCSDILDGTITEPGLWNKLYRRELFEGLESWIDSSIRINEDLLMNFYLFRQVKLAVYEDFCGYSYSLRNGSAMVSKLNEHKLKDPLKVQKILDQETAEVPEWNRIVERRLMYQLVGSSTLGLGEQKELIKPFRKEARKELRKRLWKTLKGNACGFKLKIMVLWAAVWPASYYGVHRMYARLTGSDRKYEV